MVDISAASIYRVLFGFEYIAPASTIRCDYRLIFVWDRYTIWDVEHRRESRDGEMDHQLYFTS